MKVYFVGAGPGDPELLTVRARKLLEAADVVVYAGSLVSEEVVRLARGAEVYNSFGMKLEELVHLMAENARRGRLVVRLHSGDPSIYGALAEQARELRRLGIEVEVVPGVSSLSACAASLGVPLVSGGERLAVVPAAYGVEELESLVRSFDTVVLMKVSRRFEEIAEKIARAGLEHKATVAVRCGSRGFTSGSLREVGEVEYLSMIILRGLRE